MDKKEAYCSQCLKKCKIYPIYENSIKAISRMICILLSFGAEEYQRQEYSTYHNSKVIYLNTKERIVMEL